MIINHYSFGKIVVDGKEFNHDLIIFPERILSSWWRAEGHNLCLDDLKEVLLYKPDVLVIGKGFNGLMRVDEELITSLTNSGIEVYAFKTEEAVKFFNELSESNKKVVGALHLTC